MPRPSLLVLALLGCATLAPAAELTGASFTAAVERAIAGHRLLQAEAMLDRTDVAIDGQDRARLIASLLLAQHHDQAASARFEALLKQQPGDCRLQSGAGIAALRLNQAETAEARLNAAVAACPGDADAWSALAIIDDKAGRWELSAAAYAKAIALKKDDPALLNNAGVSMLAQRRYAEAARLFRQALVLDPSNQRAKNNLDIAQVSAGARPSFDAEENSRTRAERLNNAGYAALLAGDDKAAAEYFAEAIRDNPFQFETAEANLSNVAAQDGRTP